MDIETILEDAVAMGAEQFKKDYNARDFNTTGRLKGSIKAVKNTIVANGYVWTLIEGRAPGKYPPWGEGSSLLNWTRIKIRPDEKKVKSVAFLIARRISEEGSQIYRGEKEPLDTEMTQSLTISVFQEMIKKKYHEEIKKHTSGQ